MQALLHVVWQFFYYIQKYLSLGLFFGDGEDTQLRGFFNVDYAFDLDDWTSITTYIFLLGSTPISCYYWKQNFVSRLSCECEYWSLANYCCEVVWIHRLLHELGLNMSVVPTLALGSRPRQGLTKVRAKNEPRSHISCSRECKRVQGNEPKWAPTLGNGVSMDFWIFRRWL